MKRILLVLVTITLSLSLSCCNLDGTYPPHGVWKCEEKELILDFDTNEGSITENGEEIRVHFGLSLWPRVSIIKENAEYNDNHEKEHTDFTMRYISDIKIEATYIYPKTDEEYRKKWIFTKVEKNLSFAED